MTTSALRFSRRAVAWPLAFLLIVISGVLTASSAARADVGSQVTNWAAGSGQCLDANLSGYGPGSKVQTWQCWNGANQHWAIDVSYSHRYCQSPGDGYSYCLVRNGNNPNLCLTANGSGNGAAITIDTCNVNSPYDLWTPTTAGNAHGALWLLAGSYMVLDLNRACLGSNGCNVQLWSWWGADNQRWDGWGWIT